MLTNSFTLIDVFNQFWKVCENGDRRSLTSAGLTYYYLCNVWNTCGRPISFRRQNTLICAELGISKPTLERHRNILKQAGIVNFFSKGKGDPNICYQILEFQSSKKTLLPEGKKENNVTSHVTSPVTSDDAYKQSTEKELFVVSAGEEKKFEHLKNLFEQDVGLKIKWKQNGFAAENFSDGIQQWMIQNNGGKYQDFSAVRKHFLFWIPNYNLKKQKHGNKSNNGSNAERLGTSAARVEALKNW
jgi:hypothetical protein